MVGAPHAQFPERPITSGHADRSCSLATMSSACRIRRNPPGGRLQHLITTLVLRRRVRSWNPDLCGCHPPRFRPSYSHAPRPTTRVGSTHPSQAPTAPILGVTPSVGIGWAPRSFQTPCAAPKPLLLTDRPPGTPPLSNDLDRPIHNPLLPLTLPAPPRPPPMAPPAMSRSTNTRRSHARSTA